MARKYQPYTIIRDTREQTGWTWAADVDKSYYIPILGTVTSCLDAGDYSVQGKEGLIRIERKASFAELYGNLVDKDNKERFYREMEKLKDIPYKCIVIESNISKEIFGMSPCNLFRPIPCTKIINELNKIYFEFGVPYHFVGDAGMKFTRMYIDQILRIENV